MEEWKDIKGFEGYYQVSNHGRVRSLPRYTKNRYSVMLKKGVILTPMIDRNGYCGVRLQKNGKGYSKLIHRLVAEAFIPNPKSYREINHIDEDKSNNLADNLEWCSRDYNMNYGERPKIYAMPVKQYTITGNFVNEFDSIQDAMRKTGVHAGNICACCHGRYKSAGGYKWKFC